MIFLKIGEIFSHKPFNKKVLRLNLTRMTSNPMRIIIQDKQKSLQDGEFFDRPIYDKNKKIGVVRYDKYKFWFIPIDEM